MIVTRKWKYEEIDERRSLGFRDGSKAFRLFLQRRLVEGEEEHLHQSIEMMNPNTDKLVRRSSMGITVVAAYFLLTADYGPQPNALDPIKNALLSAQRSAKEMVFGQKKEDATGKPRSDPSKDSP